MAPAEFEPLGGEPRIVEPGWKIRTLSEKFHRGEQEFRFRFNLECSKEDDQVDVYWALLRVESRLKIGKLRIGEKRFYEQELHQSLNREDLSLKVVADEIGIEQHTFGTVRFR